ncbi:hypothetical protein [Streptomyces griseofuscus]|uniref:hypothetical protein n=1 Tax=Streptomyces griseofuscus TaxID=146922 RepID=UPI0036AFD1AC
MSTNTAPTTAPRPANTERRIAVATSLAPLTAGILTPLLNHDTALALDLAYLPTAALTTAAVMDWIPHTTYQQLPAGDILHRHRLPAFLSTLATGVALGMGTFTGTQGADALLAGILDPLTAQGIVSLGWWATVALVPIKLRRVLTSRKPRTARPATAHGVIPAKPTAPPPPQTPEQQILHAWGQHISHPDTGSHRGQTLRLRTISAYRWQGTITAPIGSTVTVTQEAVSSIYRIPTEWITLRTGAHAGEANITVNLQAPAELDTSTLAGAWRKWAARTGGLMEGTHLKNIQPDPNTGGEVALVVAGENLDRLRHPDRLDLAGALRTKPLLISYEPRQDPREAVIRKMAHNPLQKGAAFPGTHVLKPNTNGYIQLGVGVSGFPARIQIWDPALGAQHCIVAGVTGSGKGGTLQLLALAHHINGSAIIYADPKGSSNPAIEKMAAYSGLGLDGAMGALRAWFNLLMYRVEESGRLGMKNFQPSNDRPWVPLILDEASKLLGERAEHKKEATFIINAGATLGRSLGMPVILANQLMQLKEFGGDAAIRDNVFYGGSLVLLRSDSQQKHLIDLPENFAGCNPADIPPAWAGDRDMVFDPTKPLNDPERTFGLGFAASAGAHAEMMRNWILEDATPYIDTNNIAHPADWPSWDQRDELAQQSVLPGDQQTDDDASTLLFSTTDIAPKKPTSAKEKILSTLQDLADPLGIDTNYTHKDDIGRLAGVEGQTLANTLSQLVKTNEIHRGPDAGTYGLGPAPATNTAE